MTSLGVILFPPIEIESVGGKAWKSVDHWDTKTRAVYHSESIPNTPLRRYLEQKSCQSKGNQLYRFVYV